MKKLFCCFVLLFTVFFVPAASAQDKVKGEFTITGYPDRGYAIVGEIAVQFEGQTGKIKSALPIVEYDFIFTIYGNASATGSDNDEWGKKRANEAKEYLLGIFPNGKYVVRTLGQELNQKSVKVVWEAIPKNVPIPVNKSELPTLWQMHSTSIIMTVVFFLISLILFFLFPIRRQQQVAKKIEPELPKLPRTRVEAIRIMVGKTIFEVPTTVDYDASEDPVRLTSIFTSPNGAPIIRSTLERMKDSLRGCLKENDENFRAQREEFLKNGTIKIVSA
jgi:hypothetical protein